MKLFILGFVFLTSSAFAQWHSSFSTQISPKLSISGFACRGGEFSSGVNVAPCEEGQWLVTVDDANVCYEDGPCTELYVPNFVAELVRVPMITIPEYAVFDIVPLSPVSNEIESILRKHFLRDNMNGVAEVFPKR